VTCGAMRGCVGCRESHAAGAALKTTLGLGQRVISTRSVAGTHTTEPSSHRVSRLTGRWGLAAQPVFDPGHSACRPPGQSRRSLAKATPSRDVQAPQRATGGQAEERDIGIDMQRCHRLGGLQRHRDVARRCSRAAAPPSAPVPSRRRRACRIFIVMPPGCHRPHRRANAPGPAAGPRPRACRVHAPGGRLRGPACGYRT
jgi:hypothetical protein